MNVVANGSIYDSSRAGEALRNLTYDDSETNPKRTKVKLATWIIEQLLEMAQYGNTKAKENAAWTLHLFEVVDELKEIIDKVKPV